jgi:hypothetical protein
VIKQLNVRLDEKVIKEMKTFCIQNDLTIQEFIEKSIKEILSSAEVK